MQINSITSSSVATSVWAASTRELKTTSIGINGATSRPSIGNNAILDLRSTTSGVRRLTCAAVTPASAGQTFGVYDGSNYDGAETISVTNCVKSGFATPSAGIAMKNASGGALSYSYTGFELPY